MSKDIDWPTLIALAGSRKQLAADLGTTEPAICRWVNGQRKPSGILLKCIEYYLAQKK